MSKILTVFGATGQQGGALIDYVLKHQVLSQIYSLRAVTRDGSKPAAEALRNAGVEIAEADMDDYDSLVKAVKGSYAVFSMTQYWENMSTTIEVAQGKAIADASVATGVSLMIWSSLARNGLPQFDSKADVEAYIRTLPIMSAFFMPGWFMSNLRHPMGPKLLRDEEAGDDESYLLHWELWTTNTQTPVIDIGDTGKFLAPVLADPEKYDGKNLTAATAFYTPDEIAEALSEATGKKFRFAQRASKRNEPTVSSPKSESFDSSKLSQGYYGPSGREDLEWTLQQMEEKPTTFVEYLKANGPWV